MNKQANKVWLGVGIILENAQGDILMMKRKAVHGKGTYSIPGGAVDAGEGIEQAALRELKEETGLEAQQLQCLGLTNNLQTYTTEGVHVASMIFYSNTFSGTLCCKEPHKHELLGWYNIKSLPSPLFEASGLALDLMRNSLSSTSEHDCIVQGRDGQKRINECAIQEGRLAPL